MWIENNLNVWHSISIFAIEFSYIKKCYIIKIKDLSSFGFIYQINRAIVQLKFIYIKYVGQYYLEYVILTYRDRNTINNFNPYS